MKKCLLLLLTAALALNCLSGCAQAPAEETVSAESAQYEPQTAAVSSVTELEGKTLTIDAEVTIPDLSRMEKITLAFDEEAFQRAGRELALARYPQLKEENSPDGYRGWRKITEQGLGVIFDCQDDGFESGRCYYEYLDNDLNGQAMPGDESRYFDRNYFSEHIPNKLGMTSREAAEKIGQELHKYSCFTYAPWSVTAHNVRENPESSGYYSARMSPCFGGFPVYGHGALPVSAHYSAEGLFAFQGILVLKETGREAVACEMDLDEALARVKEDFVEAAGKGSQVLVDRITLGYKAVSEYDGTWTLSPVWAFQCSEAREGYTFCYTIVYKLENGAMSVIEMM